ncbi:helix-turn-helix domain-containing protein [Gordonia malaquae]|uniref:Putative Xre family DNA-binding protein n=1 Tax=Gordonia malaquae NBRC 108250 TaxID=1223542 RepID=M3UM41_GORML|nr:helix-turn-helix transcriptional regulator [Gordonia malaquae]GAC80860.1 putative Xre family DNA-binding protein [Gordonia malaquae NBRC 108250]
MPAPDDRLTPRQRRDRVVRREALAAALVAAREQAGLNQSQLAQASGLSRSAVVRLEKGDASISSDRLWDLARALGTKPSALYPAAEANEAAGRTLD